MYQLEGDVRQVSGHPDMEPDLVVQFIVLSLLLRQLFLRNLVQISLDRYKLLAFLCVVI